MAGIIMWIPGSMMFLLAAFILDGKILVGNDDSTPTPRSMAEELASDEKLIAPGVEHRVIQNRWRELNTPGVIPRMWATRLMTPLDLRGARSSASCAGRAVVSRPGSSLLAHGGGTSQLSNAEAGPYRVFAWTTPEPWRAGEVHVTVAVTLPPPAGTVIDDNS